MSNVIALIGHMTDEEKVAVRTRVAAVVNKLTIVLEEMIAALDQLDGEPDLEPTMGYVPPGHVGGTRFEYKGQMSLSLVCHLSISSLIRLLRPAGRW